MSDLTQILARGASASLKGIAVRRVAQVVDAAGMARWTSNATMARACPVLKTAWMVETVDVAGRCDRLVQADYAGARLKAHAILGQCGVSRKPFPPSVEDWAFDVVDGRLMSLPSLELGAGCAA